MAAGSGEWLDLLQVVEDSEARGPLVSFAVSLTDEVGGEERGRHDRRARARLGEALEQASGPDRYRAAALASVLHDLVDQGWPLRVEDMTVLVRAPAHHAARRSSEATKERLRAQLLVARDKQLRKPSVRRFIESMERARLHGLRHRSIFDLMRDGRELVAELEPLRALSPEERPGALADVIQPYLQVAAADARCEHTGLKLTDIWRYFRHTWSVPYKSIPGRSMPILVRDRAQECHPVIGIAAISSAVIHLGLRDRWIGWEARALLRQLQDEPEPRIAEWLPRFVEEKLSELYTADLLEDELLTPEQLRMPTPEVSTLLREHAVEQRAAHRRLSSTTTHKSLDPLTATDEDWEEQARTPLFRSKRAKELAALLRGRLELARAYEGRAPVEGLRALLETGAGRQTVHSLLVLAKHEHVGISIADITVCGAVAPYSHLLGGKLVAMLMASPEVNEAYQERYADASSIIASSKAGQAVQRVPGLMYLSTTSVFHVNASQYNRIRVPCELVGGEGGCAVRYHRLGQTEGVGSLQYSAETSRALTEMLTKEGDGGRSVNYVYGEGVNPRLRLIREGLGELGLPETLLHHGNPRVVYGVPLIRNLRDVTVHCTPSAAVVTAG